MSFFYSSPLGPLIALTDEDKLFLLEFYEPKSGKSQCIALSKKINCQIEERVTPFHQTLTQNLNLYFSQKKDSFSLPLAIIGTPFQKEVWQALLKIPFGEKRSYKQIAESIGRPKAVRAVGQAIGCNPISLFIPCHRVISADGTLGGYAWGLKRKEWLLEHENIYSPIN